jgi:hypothetical protein
MNFQEGILDVIVAQFRQQSAHLALPKQKVKKNAINANKCKKCRKFKKIPICLLRNSSM